MTFDAPWALLLLIPWCVAVYLLSTRASTTHLVPFVGFWPRSSAPAASLTGRRNLQPWLVALLLGLLLLIVATARPTLTHPPSATATSSSHSTLQSPPNGKGPSPPSNTRPTSLPAIELVDTETIPWPYRRLSQLINRQVTAPSHTITVGTTTAARLIVTTTSRPSQSLPPASSLQLTDHPVSRAIDFSRLPADSLVSPPPTSFTPIVSISDIPLLSRSSDHQQLHIGLHGPAFEQSADFVVLFVECLRTLTTLEAQPPARPPKSNSRMPPPGQPVVSKQLD